MLPDKPPSDAELLVALVLNWHECKQGQRDKQPAHAALIYLPSSTRNPASTSHTLVSRLCPTSLIHFCRSRVASAIRYRYSTPFLRSPSSVIIHRASTTACAQLGFLSITGIVISAWPHITPTSISHNLSSTPLNPPPQWPIKALAACSTHREVMLATRHILADCPISQTYLRKHRFNPQTRMTICYNSSAMADAPTESASGLPAREGLLQIVETCHQTSEAENLHHYSNPLQGTAHGGMEKKTMPQLPHRLR